MLMLFDSAIPLQGIYSKESTMYVCKVRATKIAFKMFFEIVKNQPNKCSTIGNRLNYRCSYWNMM